MEERYVNNFACVYTHASIILIGGSQNPAKERDQEAMVPSQAFKISGRSAPEPQDSSSAVKTTDLSQDDEESEPYYSQVLAIVADKHSKSESTCEMNPNVCYSIVQPPKASVAESSAACTSEKLSTVMSPEYDDVLPR